MDFEKAAEDTSMYDLIINATPLGTFPNIEVSPLPELKEIKREVIVYDLVYNPEKTQLLRDAQALSDGAIIINGVEMLIEQAAHSFKIWTGHDMPRDVVRQALLKVF
jgi:shikimate dehydrogenase